jgi:hypothetical protein
MARQFCVKTRVNSPGRFRTFGAKNVLSIAPKGPFGAKRADWG